MNILFLGSIYEDSILENFKFNSSYIDIAGDSLQKNILEGFFLNNANVNVISIPVVKGFSKIVPKKEFKFLGYNCVSIEFIDIPFLKFSTSFFILLIKLIKLKNNFQCFLIYSTQTNILLACWILNFFSTKKIPLYIIITDLPEYMNPTQSFLIKFLKKFQISLTNFFLKEYSGFILLTEFMRDRLPVLKSRFMVCEGIATILKQTDSLKKFDEFTFLYSGSLDIRYGLDNLLNAFISISNPYIRLIICGAGNLEDKIKKYITVDNRILYLGQIDRSEVLKLQKKVHLLVNPRLPSENFVKYSFPSKILEYFSSGTPVLMYKLPGIPKEYFSKCFVLDDCEVSSLIEKMKYLIYLDKSYLAKVGLDARKFVEKHKNPKIQAYKILKFLKS